MVECLTKRLSDTKNEWIELTHQQKRYLKVKRLLDILISFAMLVLLSPVFLLVGIAIKLDSPSEKVWFQQMRVGQNNRGFVLIKFRSMKSDAPEDVPTRNFKNSDQYITPLGNLLRRTSIDELPQLWNVLKGDMSLLGPRPLVFNEGDIHSLRQRYGIYQLKPGIAGLAQINGRDFLDDYEKVAYDREYLKNLSLGQDFRLIWQTIRVVLSKKGYQDGDDLNTKNGDKGEYSY